LEVDWIFASFIKGRLVKRVREIQNIPRMVSKKKYDIGRIQGIGFIMLKMVVFIVMIEYFLVGIWTSNVRESVW